MKKILCKKTIAQMKAFLIYKNVSLFLHTHNDGEGGEQQAVVAAE